MIQRALTAIAAILVIVYVPMAIGPYVLTAIGMNQGNPPAFAYWLFGFFGLLLCLPIIGALKRLFHWIKTGA
jgi:hypothetical protein